MPLTAQGDDFHWLGPSRALRVGQVQAGQPRCVALFDGANSPVMHYTMPWQELYVVDASALGSLVPIQKNDSIDLSVYLSALGMVREVSHRR